MKSILRFNTYVILCICLLHTNIAYNQSSLYPNVLNDNIAIDSINKNRLKFLIIGGGAVYTIGSAALYQTWYKDYPLSSFHFFDDLGEWNNMDKAGHVFSSYNQTYLSYKGLRWAGLSKNKSILYGPLCGTLFQSTIEIMDGFSTNWGFSWSDFTANLIGAGAFAWQQQKWDEQKIRIKFSVFHQSYGHTISQNGQFIDLAKRSDELFGKSYLEKMLKDYNAQTIWLSFNIKSLFPQKSIPKWINLSIGYGAENLFGGFSNQWMDEGSLVQLVERDKRYHQFYISLDTDLSKINTNSPFLRTVLDVMNIIKTPFSAIEINTLGEVKFLLLHF